MPIPIIFAVAGLFIAAYNRDKIADALHDALNTPEGKDFANDLSKVAQAYLTPYQEMIEQSYHKETDARRQFFIEKKETMSNDSWIALVGCGRNMSQENPKYVLVYSDLSYVNSLDL